MAESFAKCRLLILDVDGVLTDGTKQYDRDGQVVGKSFNDRDFTAIKRFVKDGVVVCLLSADRKVTERIAAKRHIDFHYARAEDGSVDKLSFLAPLQRQYGVSQEEMAFVGDDCGDVPLLDALETTFCPSTAPKIVRTAASHVLEGRGGDGLVAELYDMFEALR